MPTSSPSLPKADPGRVPPLAPLGWRWLGRRPFEEVAALQEQVRAEVLAGEGTEQLLLVEHPSTVSLGRSATAEHIVADRTWLADRGVTVVRATRGGDVTYHGPGQLVAYPVIRLSAGVLFHVSALADAVVGLLAEEGVVGTWRRDHPGVWVDGAKIAAVGVNVHRRVAIHGIALNVSTELSAFEWIVPCGLKGSRVTSLEVQTKRSLDSSEVAPRLASHLARALGRSLVALAPG